ILAKHSGSKTWKNLTRFKYIHENKSYEDPSLWYRSGGCDRVAFYMNRRAFEAKMTLLRKYELAGFSFWQLLSNNDPGINDYLSLLMTDKLPKVKTAKEEDAERKEKEALEEKLKAEKLAAEKASKPEKETAPEKSRERTAD
ncbi:MAG TPA: hydrolase, partial [Leptospiraceae bacterium]|nr:hydrolase [Leptospiraceae bacterium]